MLTHVGTVLRTGAQLYCRTHKGYEEVTVPAVQGLPPPGPDELVPIASLEPWAQAAFPGYKTLNRIQSRIFQTAYYRSVLLSLSRALIAVLCCVRACQVQRLGWSL
jgi:hypothetical protein